MEQVGYVYRNFDLALGSYSSAGGVEELTVACTVDGIAGPAEASRIPEELRRQLSIFQPERSPSQAELIQLGKQLSDVMLPPAARSRLAGERAGLEGTRRLRLRLRFDHPALATLPWEFAYLTPPDTPAGEEGLAGFLVLDPTLSIVRYEVLSDQARTLDPIGESIAAVCLFANPREVGSAPLDLEKERRKIEEALGRQSIKPWVYLNATRTELLESVERLPHVFHYGGHGMFSGDLHSSGAGEGFLLLEDEEEGYFAFPSENLGISLKGAGTRLAVLTACEVARRDDFAFWSGVTPALVKHAGIPAVVGMQHAVRDASACTFSESFYRRIASGDPIDFAVTAGRISVLNLLDGSADWGAPVLYLRAEKGVLFPKTAVQGTDWGIVREAAASQSRSALLDLQGDAGALGRVIPEVAVRRPEVEESLERFLDGDRRAVVLIGHSGTGKTNLLAAWSASLVEQGHLVLFYDCRTHLGRGVKAELARHLGAGSPAEVGAELDRVGKLAPAGKRVVLVFDGLNEFRSAQGPGPSALLGQLDELVGEISSGAVKLVISCATPTWTSMERQGAAGLRWELYHSPGATRTLELGLFDGATLREACARYRQYFDIRSDLAQLARQRDELRLPLALRLLCETYRGREVPAHRGFYLPLLEAYHRRFAQGAGHAAFLEQLAKLMQKRSRTAVPPRELSSIDGWEAALPALVDAGALTTIFDPVAMQELASFTHTRYGSYVLALGLGEERGRRLDESVRELVARMEVFPPGWDAARMALTMSGDAGVISGLARSRKPELWELAAQALRDLYLENLPAGSALMQSFLSSDDKDLQSLALRTLHRLGPGASELYLWVASEAESQEVRQAAAYSLCLWYPRRPRFTWGVFDALASEVKLSRLPSSLKKIEFLINGTINVYSNYCQQEGIAQQISDIWYKVLKKRLRIHKINFSLIAEGLTPIVSRTVSRRILNSLSFPKRDARAADPDAEDAIFRIPPSERRSLRSGAELLDPEAALAGREDVLCELFESPSGLESILGMMILGSHACRDFAAARPVTENVFERVSGDARCWVLLSFCLRFPDPEVFRSWLPTVEQLTRRIFDEHPETISARGGSLGIEEFDPILLPLGLAYGRLGSEPQLFTELLRRASDRRDPAQLAGCARALGPVGFYHPRLALVPFREVLPHGSDPQVVDALTRPLGLIWTVHVDEVDRYMQSHGWSDQNQMNVRGRSSMAMVSDYISRLGLLNNGVHQVVNYPPMRKGIVLKAVQVLFDAATPGDFFRDYTTAFTKLVQEVDYTLMRLTSPD